MSADNYCFICSMPPYISRYFSLNPEYLNKNLQKSVNEIEKNLCQIANILMILLF